MSRFQGIVAVLAAAPFVAGCEGASYGIHRRLCSGRVVEVTSTKFTRWKSPPWASRVARIGPRRVAIEPTRIMVDGELVATIDEETKRVIVAEEGEELWIVADGVTVYKGPFTPSESAKGEAMAVETPAPPEAGGP